MSHINKFRYLTVIQQVYASAYGWEDVSEYDNNEPDEMYTLKYDIGEYRLLGYPTRTIQRREQNN
jgi:hypothetical protein